MIRSSKRTSTNQKAQQDPTKTSTKGALFAKEYLDSREDSAPERTRITRNEKDTFIRCNRKQEEQDKGKFQPPPPNAHRIGTRNLVLASRSKKPGEDPFYYGRWDRVGSSRSRAVEDGQETV